MGCLWEAMIVHCNKYCEVVSTLEVRHKHTLFHSVYYHGNFWKYTKITMVVHAAIPGCIVKWLMLLKSDITHIMLVTMLLLSGQHPQIESTFVCS